MLFGGIETGGTKIVCATGDGKGNVVEKIVFPTTTPLENINQIISFFEDKEIISLGIASFGPIELDVNSENYGCMLRTPKDGWDNFNIVKELKERINVPIAIDTDVNGACLGELRYGAGQGLDPVIYITIGTGIGVGVYINDSLLHGLMHTESGHILMDKHKNDNGNCICKFHDSCFEGLASGPSIKSRWGKEPYELVENKEVWELESRYISEAICNYIMCYSPKKIILGGGVMHNKYLYGLVRKDVIKKLGGYIPRKEILEDIDNYIVEPVLGDNAGVIGAIEIGRRANNR